MFSDLNMEQKPPTKPIPPIRVLNQPRTVQYYLGPRGLIFFLLAVIVIIVGVIGYVRYDSIVEPYIEFYICCLPAVILAGILSMKLEIRKLISCS